MARVRKPAIVRARTDADDTHAYDSRRDTVACSARVIGPYASAAGHRSCAEPETPLLEPDGDGVAGVRTRVQLLFAIAGYLFAWRENGSTAHGARVLRRLRTLGVPYLAWSAIAIGVTWALEQWLVTRGFVGSAALSPFQPEALFVSQYSPGQLFERWLFVPAAFQLWFLRSLIFLTALYPRLRTVSTRCRESEGLLFYTLSARSRAS